MVFTKTASLLKLLNVGYQDSTHMRDRRMTAVDGPSTQLLLRDRLLYTAKQLFNRAENVLFETSWTARSLSCTLCLLLRRRSSSFCDVNSRAELLWSRKTINRAVQMYGAVESLKTRAERQGFSGKDGRLCLKCIVSRAVLVLGELTLRVRGTENRKILRV